MMHARTGRLFIAALAAASLGAVGIAGTASAGEQNAAPLTIVKTVSGPVPAGTTFTATLECTDVDVNPAAQADRTETVTFDATGQPTSPDTFYFDGPAECTVTETANGGATSTTYACDGSYPVDEEEPSTEPIEPEGGFSAQQIGPTSPVCPAAGPQAAPIAVNIVQPDQTATVTIANTFAAATPQPAAQILARPLFTG